MIIEEKCRLNETETRIPYSEKDYVADLKQAI